MIKENPESLKEKTTGFKSSLITKTSGEVVEGTPTINEESNQEHAALCHPSALLPVLWRRPFRESH
jgi:hypothetical protein